MIITVTMNPAIDKTIDLDNFVHGGLNRISHIENDAGGKGINVSKTIHHLGGTSLAVGFLGGDAGDYIERSLNEYGIQTDFVRVSGETRTNTKVVEKNGMVTELNEAGPVVTSEDVDALIAKLEGYASPDVLIVLAGSIPVGVDKNIYRVITEKAHAKGAKVLLDADGDLFTLGLQAQPDIIKPNYMELKTHFQQAGMYFPESIVDQGIFSMGYFLLSSGISEVVISRGGDGAIFLNEKEMYLCPSLPVHAHSTVGAGDAMVAAIAYGWEQKQSFREIARLAMAASAGAVTTIGTKPPSRELVDELLPLVEFT